MPSAACKEKGGKRTRALPEETKKRRGLNPVVDSVHHVGLDGKREGEGTYPRTVQGGGKVLPQLRDRLGERTFGPLDAYRRGKRGGKKGGKGMGRLPMRDMG